MQHTNDHEYTTEYDEPVNDYVDDYVDEYDYYLDDDEDLANIDTHPFEFSEENRSKIVELFTLEKAIRTKQLDLIDYVFTSLQKNDPARFTEESEWIKENLIEMPVTIEILEYFKSKSESCNYFHPIQESGTFHSNMNDIDVCRWIVENCGIGEKFYTFPFHLEYLFGDIINNGSVDFLRFFLREVYSFETMFSFSSSIRIFNDAYKAGHKDMLKYLLINPKMRNLLLIKFSSDDYLWLRYPHRVTGEPYLMEHEVLSDEEIAKYDGDEIIKNVTREGIRLFGDVLDALLKIYGYEEILTCDDYYK